MSPPPTVWLGDVAALPFLRASSPRIPLHRSPRRHSTPCLFSDSSPPPTVPIGAAATPRHVSSRIRLRLPRSRSAPLLSPSSASPPSPPPVSPPLNVPPPPHQPPTLRPLQRRRSYPQLSPSSALPLFPPPSLPLSPSLPRRSRISPYLQSVGFDYRHGANFATLASTALLPNTSLFVTGTSPFSLGIQLNQMKEFRSKVLSSGGNNGQLPPPNVFGNSLYTIDIGQNDFTSNLGSLGVETVKQSLPSVVTQISWTIQDLYNIGARKFMVFNMAPIGCYPAFLTELPHSSNDLDEYGRMETYNSLVLYYNELLNNSLAQVAKKLQAQVAKKLQDASIVYIDKHSVTL